MGGTGSGFPYWKARKTTVEECLHLDVVWFKIKKHLGKQVAGNIAWTDRKTGAKMSGADLALDLRDPYRASVQIRYRHRETGTLHQQDFSLTPTEPYFGGLRYWLCCPLCLRRVRKIYLPMNGSTDFACRHCYDLTHESCQDAHRWDRLFRDIAREVYGETSDEHLSHVSRQLIAGCDPDKHATWFLKGLLQTV